MEPNRIEERPSLSVIVPAYNESAIIESSLKQLHAYLETLEHRWRWELIVVNDGSSDNTGALAEAFASDREHVRVLQHPSNFRLGQALRYGFSNARCDVVIPFDLDLTYAPDHIERLADQMHDSGARIVVASPYMTGGRTTGIPFHRKWLSRCANWFLALTARGVGPSCNLSTMTGMVRAYDRKFLEALNLKSMGAEINTEIIYKAFILGVKIDEIPAHLDWSGFAASEAPRTSSKRISRSILFSLFAGFIMRPFAFFVIPGLALGGVAMYVLVWIMIHMWNHYQAFPSTAEFFDFGFSAALKSAFEQSPHAFLVGGVTLLLSVQLFSLGVLAVQVKQYFEELFHFSTTVLRHSKELERHMEELRRLHDRS